MNKHDFLTMRMVSKSWSAVGIRCALVNLVYILDRLHERNHTDCRTPGNKYYDESLVLSYHPQWRHFPSTRAEVTFSWMSRHNVVARMFTYERNRLFLLVVVFWRNARI